MIIQNKSQKRGFSVNLFKNASIDYQGDIWSSLKQETREAIMDNLIYLKFSPYCMFQDKETHFDLSLPYLRELGDKGVIRDMPRIAEEDKVSTKKLIEKFKNKKIKFKNKNVKLINGFKTNNTSLVGMSFGKDSLLSYGISKELGLIPKLVMVQDFWDTEAQHKFDIIKKFEKEFNEKIHLIYDRMDDVSTYKRINKTNSEGIVGANAMNSYIVMLLPLAIKHNTSTLVFGNEQNFNDYFVNKEGFKVYPSYEQSSEWMVEQNKALKKFTHNKFKVSSFIEPLYNIAEVKVLFNRYPYIAKYQMSCSHTARENKLNRWCYRCPMCAKAFLYLKASNVNPRMVSFNENFFNKKFKGFYPLFKKQERIYEKPQAVRDEQLFAFYLSLKNKNRGYLIEKFRKNFLKEAKEREDELYNKFFKVHNAVSIHGKIKKEINSIYKEELS